MVGFEDDGAINFRLYALQLIHQTTGVQLPVAVFFTHPSASQLAEIVGGGSGTGA